MVLYLITGQRPSPLSHALPASTTVLPLINHFTLHSLNPFHKTSLLIVPSLDYAVSNSSANGMNMTGNCLVTDPPLTSVQASKLVSTCADPDKYFFWDGVHPTAQGHKLLAAALAGIFSKNGLLNSAM